MEKEEKIREFLNSDRLNFIETFKEICLRQGKHCALEIKDKESYRKISYLDLWNTSFDISTYLMNFGIKEKECVALLFENRPEWAVCFLGIAFSGAVVVPLEIKLKEKELTYVLTDCKSRIIFVDAANVTRAKELKRLCPDLQTIVCLDAWDKADIEVVDFVQIKYLDENKILRSNSRTDVALMVYTSGTTGYQKGVQITFANLLFQVRAFQKVLRPKPTDKFLSILPLSHTLEISCGLLSPLFSNCCVSYLGSLKSKDIHKEIKDGQITMMIVVPLVLRMLHNAILRNVEKSAIFVRLYFSISRYICLSLGRLGISFGKILFKKIHKEIGKSLRCFVCGGAPLDAIVAYDFELFGISVLEGYGLTETSPVISVNTLKENKIGSVGKPLAGVEVRILKDNKKAKEGEIITRGPHLMKGYFNDPQKTQEVIRNGWLHTGDIGFFDKQGFLHVSGRLKDVIVTGKGKKVFPEELETELLRSPYIKEACVFGNIAKEGLKKGTEEVNAVIVPDMDYFLSSAKKATKEDIEWLIKQEIKELSKNLADYKRISDFKIWYQELPKTTTKKIKRKEIKNLISNNNNK